MTNTDHAAIREAALRRLARREHSFRELSLKLQAKGFDAADIEAVLRELTQENLLSDERFAESFVASRIGRGSGPVRITAELRQRGVADELLECSLAAAQQDWSARAEAARVKRFGSNKPRSFTERAKQARFLQYRGFRAEHIREVLGEQNIETIVVDSDGDV